MKGLLKKFGIYHEHFDQEGRIIPGNQDFWNFLDSGLPDSHVSLFDVFPELVGMEDTVEQVLRREMPEFRLPGIQRGDIFLHLSLLTDPLLVIIQDASEEMYHRRYLVQSRNEISLLQNNLQEKNNELASVNIQLDSLMKSIREQNHELDRRVKQQTRELRISRFKALSTLARIAEFRDSDTGGHIYRIGRISAIIADELGFSAQERETLFYAALLHDVGKIGVPDDILLKPEPLNSRELEIMRQHPRIGAEILSDNTSDIFSAAREVALYHHEHWDGNGYPDSLKGEDIPVRARICAVADVFDALVSRRPYKEPWPYNKALQHIESCTGSHFDPDVVKAFFVQKEKIMKLFSQTSEELDLLEPESY